MMLAGELSNSAATTVQDIDDVMPRMRALGLNTVLVPLYWELTEPEEGEFDFSLADRTILKARENGLNVVFLWFGAWKNSMSCYAPLWVKQDVKRFPRAENADGKRLEILSPFSRNTLEADKRAFLMLMRHLRSVDERQKTVLMVQVENEIGMLESARDMSPLALEAYREAVPESLLAALKCSKRGTWAEVFGADCYASEKFMAYHYARYVEALAQEGKRIYDLPMYVNAAMNSRNRLPGEYPSAGPLPHLMDIWKAAAESLDLLAPDIYDEDFEHWLKGYQRADNPVFVPETQCSEDAGARAFLAFGRYGAIGFSPFAVDKAKGKPLENLLQSYKILRKLAPLKREKQWGALLKNNTDREVIRDNGKTESDNSQAVVELKHYFTLPWDKRATDGTPWTEGGAMLLRLGKGEYLLAGTGVVAKFLSREEWQVEAQKTSDTQEKLGEDGFVAKGNAAPSANDKTAKPLINAAKTSENAAPNAAKSAQNMKRLGFAYVEEVEIGSNGEMRTLRRLNGDETHQGRHARIAVGEWKILHIGLYEY